MSVALTRQSCNNIHSYITACLHLSAWSEEKALRSGLEKSGGDFRVRLRSSILA